MPCETPMCPLQFYEAQPCEEMEPPQIPEKETVRTSAL